MTDEIRARIEACHTDDGIDHGKHHIEECFWAIIDKYEDGFEEKTLVSFYSTACITVKLLFNSKCRVIFLYPMSDECFNETLRFDHFFNEAAHLFDNIHIAHSLDEAKKLLAEAG